MIVTPIKTRVLIPPQDDLLDAMRHSIKSLAEKSIVVITSKTVSIWEGRCLSQSAHKRDGLVPEEAEYYFPKIKTPLFEYQAAIKHNAFIASAGIDKSNSGNYFTLLPLKPNESAKIIWAWLRKKYGIRNCGVLITDSHLMPFRRGTVGLSIGFY
ncbi:MAG: coenzyme F420-0:L-glutamate ligase, partial [Patescibacteria group bacterium]